MFLCLAITGGIVAQNKKTIKKDEQKNEVTRKIKNVTLDASTTKLLKNKKTDMFKFDSKERMVPGEGFSMYHLKETKEILILKGDIEFNLFRRKRGKLPKAVDLGNGVVFRCSSPDPQCKVCAPDGDAEELYCQVADCNNCASSLVVPEGKTIIIESI